MNRRVITGILLYCFCALPLSVVAQEIAVPIATDSRIKTFIYNENDVFSLLTHYGYQANIEFGSKEVIETVSVGDRIAFQIIPAGRRLFIRAMEEDARTNMTIVTNIRAYQFDLKSTGSAKYSKEELVYVARFFYPDDMKSGVPQVHAHRPPLLSPALRGYGEESLSSQQGEYNFLYSVTGPEALAPVRMYDDGRATYFAFRNMQGFMPEISEVASDGRETPLQYRIMDDMLVVDRVSTRFTVRHGGEYVCVYNDMLVPIKMTLNR